MLFLHNVSFSVVNRFVFFLNFISTQDYFGHVSWDIVLFTRKLQNNCEENKILFKVKKTLLPFNVRGRVTVALWMCDWKRPPEFWSTFLFLLILLLRCGLSNDEILKTASLRFHVLWSGDWHVNLIQFTLVGNAVVCSDEYSLVLFSSVETRKPLSSLLGRLQV